MVWQSIIDLAQSVALVCIGIEGLLLRSIDRLKKRIAQLERIVIAAGAAVFK